jgi:hypothetical protein
MKKKDQRAWLVVTHKDYAKHNYLPTVSGSRFHSHKRKAEWLAKGHGLLAVAVVPVTIHWPDAKVKTLT